MANKNNISLENCMEKGIPVEYMITSVEDAIEEVLAMKEMLKPLAIGKANIYIGV